VTVAGMQIASACKRVTVPIQVNLFDVPRLIHQIPASHDGNLVRREGFTPVDFVSANPIMRTTSIIPVPNRRSKRNEIAFLVQLPFYWR
jgi:hypothetical protein